MDLKQIMAIGLTEKQAMAYALLIEEGEIKPSSAAKKLKTTRTNAYKILDKLVEVGLSFKKQSGKTFSYKPSNPNNLAKLTASMRAEATAKEEAVNSIMKTLLDKYYSHDNQPSISVATGRSEVADAYRAQIHSGGDLYFIHTTNDVPVMGFDLMHEIRTTPSRYNKKRHAIMSEPSSGIINYKNHERSGLEITWSSKSDYTAPVEWSVNDSSLLIVLYGGSKLHAITIMDPVIANAFKQIWLLLSTLLKQQKTHRKLHSYNS